MEKRQYAPQICTRADVKQPRIAVIFRCKGKRVHPDEKAARHPDVYVLWQENAWADTTVSVNWVNTTLKPVVENLEKHELFADNLNAQQRDEFKKAVSNLKGVVWYGLKHASDLWQVIDAGIAQTWKVLTGHNHQKCWMNGTRLTFGLDIKRVSRQWNVEYSSHSGSEMHGKNYVAVNTITSANAVGKKLAV